MALGARQLRARLTDGGASRLDGGAELRLRADVDERRRRGHQPGDNGLAANDGLSRLELDPLHPSHDRCRDDETLAHARLPFLVNRHLHRALLDSRDVDLNRARPQRDREDNGDDDDNRRGPAEPSVFALLLPHLQDGNQIERVQAAAHEQRRQRRGGHDAEERPRDSLTGHEQWETIHLALNAADDEARQPVSEHRAHRQRRQRQQRQLAEQNRGNLARA